MFLASGQSKRIFHRLTLGASKCVFRDEAAIAIEILARDLRISIAASPLTIAASLRKKDPLAPRVSVAALVAGFTTIRLHNVISSFTISRSGLSSS